MREEKQKELVRLLETVAEMNEKEIEVLSAFVQGMMTLKACME